MLSLVLGMVLVALGSLSAPSRRHDLAWHGDRVRRAVCGVVRLAWFIRWITEFAVTDRRVISKRGFIMRDTDEMNMDKVESVDVDQSILGRLLDYGTVP